MHLPAGNKGNEPSMNRGMSPPDTLQDLPSPPAQRVKFKHLAWSTGASLVCHCPALQPQPIMLLPPLHSTPQKHSAGCSSPNTQSLDLTPELCSCSPSSVPPSSDFSLILTLGPKGPLPLLPTWLFFPSCSRILSQPLGRSISP